jgi:HAD superfamily hydrolase (TIGR01549 family)
MIKAVVFDFDGVLVESVDLKTRAFVKLFKDQPDEVLRQIVEYHTFHGGINRNEKFRYFYKNLLKQELTRAKEEELAARFSEIVFEEVVASPWVEGARETLDALRGRVALYVASGTPHDELLLIINKRGMAQYFSGTFGAPESKSQILGRIIASLGINPDEMVMVGDSMSDLIAAQEVKSKFIGRTIKGDNRFEGMHVKTVPDLLGVSEIILGMEN